MQENFLSRTRKFTPQSLFFSVLHLAVGTNNNGYLSALHNTWQKSGFKVNTTPTKSSLSEYRDKVSFNFFKEIFLSDLNRIDFYRKKFRGFYVYAIDGDHLDLPASKDILEHGFRGTRYSETKETHYPKMYTAQVLDIVNGTIKDFSYSTEVAEIKLARTMASKLEKNSITIYDRLHSSYHTVSTHEESKNFYLIRVKEQNPKNQLNIQKFCRSKKKSQWIDLVASKPERAFLNPIPVRLVKIRNPRTQKEIVFMTNLRKNQFSNIELSLLYQRRWEIESSFKDLTDTLKMCEWHTTKFNGILQEIYALFWLVNQVRLQCSQIIRKTTSWLESEYRKPNLKLCTELVMQNLRLIIQRKPRRLQKILDFWIHRSSEKRRHLSRSYPRVTRRYGKKYINASSVERRPLPATMAGKPGARGLVPDCRMQKRESLTERHYLLNCLYQFFRNHVGQVST